MPLLAVLLALADLQLRPHVCERVHRPRRTIAICTGGCYHHAVPRRPLAGEPQPHGRWHLEGRGRHIHGHCTHHLRERVLSGLALLGQGLRHHGAVSVHRRAEVSVQNRSFW